MNKDEDICKIIDDLGHNVKGRDVLCTAIISGICTLLPFFSGYLCMDEVSELLCSVQPNLLGFTIAAYTILFNFDKDFCKRLKIIASDRKVPFEVLHASFVFALCIEGFSLIIGMLADVMLKCMDDNIAISICWFFLFFSIIWIVNMVLHLYSLRTFIVENDKESLSKKS